MSGEPAASSTDNEEEFMAKLSKRLKIGPMDIECTVDRCIPSGSRWMETEKIEPMILRGAAKEWKAFKWTHETLSEIFGGRVRVRLGRRRQIIGEIQFEKDCPRADLSFDEFLLWHSGKAAEISITDGGRANIADYWGYVDYSHLCELECSQLWSDVEWNTLGIKRDGENSTIWIGTPGAYSPCHYDALGWNVHAQLRGYKLWILAPPTCESERVLRPSRIPYEDTTIYSSVDVVGNPDALNIIPGVRAFLAGPGDVMFVPPKWWHSVQCVRSPDVESAQSPQPLSVSVNAWIEDRRDQMGIVTEALTAMLVSASVECQLFDASHLNDRVVLETSLEQYQVLIYTFIDCFGWSNKMPVMKKTKRNDNDELIGLAERRAELYKNSDDLLSPFLERFANSSVANVGVSSLRETCYRDGSRSFTGMEFIPRVTEKKSINFDYADFLLPVYVEKLLAKIVSAADQNCLTIIVS